MKEVHKNYNKGHLLGGQHFLSLLPMIYHYHNQEVQSGISVQTIISNTKSVIFHLSS